MLVALVRRRYAADSQYPYDSRALCVLPGSTARILSAAPSLDFAFAADRRPAQGRDVFFMSDEPFLTFSAAVNPGSSLNLYRLDSKLSAEIRANKPLAGLACSLSPFPILLRSSPLCSRRSFSLSSRWSAPYFDAGSSQAAGPLTTTSRLERILVLGFS